MLTCLLAYPALLAGSTSCVERVLQVRSDPEGAVVYVNGDEVGKTPLDHPFSFYGTVEVALRAGGRLSHRELKTLDTPWYEVFPLDVFSELLLPWKLRDVHSVDVILVPAPDELTEPERRGIREKAAKLSGELLSPPAADSRAR